MIDYSLKFSVLILIFLFQVRLAIGQPVVSPVQTGQQQIDAQIANLQSRINILRTEITALGFPHDPELVVKEIQRLSIIITDTLENPATIASAIELLKAENQKQEQINQVQTERTLLNEELKRLNQTILIFSQLKDNAAFSAEAKASIQEAKQTEKEVTQEIVQAFITSVKAFELDASTSAALLSLSESLIILPEGKNRSAGAWLQRATEGAALVSTVVAYGSFQDGESGLGTGMAVLGAGFLGLKQLLVGKEDNGESDLKKIAEAFSRNILFGNIIRDDQTNIELYKVHIDELVLSIPFITQGNDPKFVSSSFFPTGKTLDLADLVVEDITNRIFFNRKINSEAENLLNNFKEEMTDDSQEKLQKIIDSHDGNIKLLVSNRQKFVSQIRFVRNIQRDKSDIGGDEVTPDQ